MDNVMMGLLAETSLHPGTGQTTGAIDLPVAREAATGYPFIAGSSLKGALRDRAEQVWGREAEKVFEIFGRQDAAGALAVTDARLLLLPVRSLNGHFKWVTCPYLLERYLRDRQLAGIGGSFPVPYPGPGQAIMAGGQGLLFLEELSFEIVPGNLEEMIKCIEPLICHPPVRKRLSEGLALLADNDFVYFASYALAIQARNVLNDATKTSENLWYEETLPPDTLFYALLLTRPGKAQALTELARIFAGRPYLQVGGNETVGQGWCAVSWLSGGGEGQK